PDGPTVHYDYEAATTDFFAFPFPNALRLTETGAPDIEAFAARGTDLVEDGKVEVLDTVRGFSPSGGVYFTFEAPIDPASLPATPLASVAGDATAYLINLEVGSPRFGERSRAAVHWEAQSKKFVPSNMLVVRPATGYPMRPGERYAAVLTRDIQLETGAPIGKQPAWEDLRTGVLPPAGYPDELHRHVRQLIADLEDAGVDTDQVLVATAFEVG